MDIRTGEMYTAEEAAKILADETDERREFLKEVDPEVVAEHPLDLGRLRPIKVIAKPIHTARRIKKVQHAKAAKASRKANRHR